MKDAKMKSYQFPDPTMQIFFPGILKADSPTIRLKMNS